MRPVDISGKKFGSLTVIKRIGSRWGHSLWECRCDCGNTCERTANQLTLNNIVSCGCKTKEQQAKSRLSHGDSGTRLYRIWKAIKTRCHNHNIACAKYYSEKGVDICEEWNNSYESFKEWALSHGYAENLTIDRIDSDGNYEPNNCRWVTQAEQNRNKKKVKKNV